MVATAKWTLEKGYNSVSFADTELKLGMAEAESHPEDKLGALTGQIGDNLNISRVWAEKQQAIFIPSVDQTFLHDNLSILCLLEFIGLISFGSIYFNASSGSFVHC